MFSTQVKEMELVPRRCTPARTSPAVKTVLQLSNDQEGIMTGCNLHHSGYTSQPYVDACWSIWRVILFWGVSSGTNPILHLFIRVWSFHISLKSMSFVNRTGLTSKRWLGYATTPCLWWQMHQNYGVVTFHSQIKEVNRPMSSFKKIKESTSGAIDFFVNLYVLKSI